jgi:predicted Zn-ribbon and HTH transcriptional regulator
MKNPRSRPVVPAARSRTIRQQIIDHLKGGPVSAGVLSVEIGLAEKQVHEHLESLRSQVKLKITPARCGKCGFEFKDRRRVRKPGKCPECRGTYIEEPLYSIAD